MIMMYEYSVCWLKLFIQPNGEYQQIDREKHIKQNKTRTNANKRYKQDYYEYSKWKPILTLSLNLNKVAMSRLI